MELSKMSGVVGANIATALGVLQPSGPVTPPHTEFCALFMKPHKHLHFSLLPEGAGPALAALGALQPIEPNPPHTSLLPLFTKLHVRHCHRSLSKLFELFKPGGSPPKRADSSSPAPYGEKEDRPPLPLPPDLPNPPEEATSRGSLQPIVPVPPHIEFASRFMKPQELHCQPDIATKQKVNYCTTLTVS